MLAEAGTQYVHWSHFMICYQNCVCCSEVSEPVPPKPRREGRSVANGPCERQPADGRGRVSRNSHQKQLAPGCEDRERTPSIEERLQHGHQRSYKHTVTGV